MRIKLIVAYLFLCSSTFFYSCASTDKWVPNLPEDIGVTEDGKLGYVLEYIRNSYHLPSLGGMLIISGQIIESETVGFRKLGDDVHVTYQDRWHLGSMGKAMTATLAAIFVERGYISWNSTIEEVIPELIEKARPEYLNVTLYELLSHTGGLPSYGSITKVPSWYSFFNNPSPIRIQRRQFVEEFLALEPGGLRGKYLYSNGGYIIAAAMIEKVTSLSWEQLMNAEIFHKLGMRSTGFGAPGTACNIDQPRGHIVPTPDSMGFYSPVEPGPYADYPPVIRPAGLIHSTLEDYAKFIAEHIAGARGLDGIVTAETFKILHTPAPGTSYALGWAIDSSDWAGGYALYHDGSNLRWYAHVWIAPQRDLAAVTVTNAGQTPAKEGSLAALKAIVERFKVTAEERKR